jgi:hypothetical protein
MEHTSVKEFDYDITETDIQDLVKKVDAFTESQSDHAFVLGILFAAQHAATLGHPHFDKFARLISDNAHDMLRRYKAIHGEWT